LYPEQGPTGVSLETSSHPSERIFQNTFDRQGETS